jgi:hypothetical protein
MVMRIDIDVLWVDESCQDRVQWGRRREGFLGMVGVSRQDG